jgi:hypothetical protein
MHGDQRSRILGHVAVKVTVAVVLAAVAMYFFRTSLLRIYLATQFTEATLTGYESYFAREQPSRLGQGEMPYRSGKVVLVVPSRWSVYREGTFFTTQMNEHYEKKKEYRMDPPRLDDHHAALPGALRASSPDDVDTVILCEYGHTRTGSYVHVSGGGPVYAATRRNVRLFVYDRRSRDLIGTFVVKGNEPKWRTSVLGEHSGSIPDLTQFVEEMPLR